MTKGYRFGNEQAAKSPGQKDSARYRGGQALFIEDQTAASVGPEDRRIADQRTEGPPEYPVNSSADDSWKVRPSRASPSPRWRAIW